MDYDVAIIGSGAGGGTLAYTLASSGLNVLILERGDFLPREKENWEAGEVFIRDRYTAKDPWLDKKGKPFQASTHYYVGGNTKFYGSALFRMREKDFGEVIHHGGLSPAWPLSYQELQPYYLMAEKLYKVHGERGADPLEPPEAAPYPYPKVSHEPRIQAIADDLQKKGIGAYHLPLGIHIDEQTPEQSACIRCDTCDGFPCLVNAKSDAQVSCINPALKHSNVSLLTKAFVKRLHTSPSGEVSHLEVEREGETLHIKAHVVVSACGAINSAALLLRSRNDQYPLGLANSSGLVGCNYMCHNNLIVVALSTTPNETLFQKTIGISDYYYGDEEWQYPYGHIQLLGKVAKEMFSSDAPKFTPGIALEKMADHSIGWWLCSEDLPDKENRVEVTKEGQVILKRTANNLEGHKRLYQKLKTILAHTGFDHHHFEGQLYLHKETPLAAVAHQVGTCRFGHDAKDSVLDLNCQAHDHSNLYVVDGSFFPSSSAVNPGLTIMANAIRVGQHLCERFNVKSHFFEEFSC